MASDFVCPECGARFPTENALMEHELSMHPKMAAKMGDFDCKICGAHFHSEAELKAHVAKAHAK